jgi:hypothetical protein
MGAASGGPSRSVVAAESVLDDDADDDAAEAPAPADDA